MPTASAPLASPPSARPRLALVVPYPPSVTETFIRDHERRLPAQVQMLVGHRPTIGVGGPTVLPLRSLVTHKLRRKLLGESLQVERTAAYVKAFREFRPAAVLGEYGQTSWAALDASRRLGIPLVAHFHGYDASVRELLDEYRDRYRELFRDAAAIVAVSQAQRRALIDLGARPETVHWNPCGVDCDRFEAVSPEHAPPTFVAIGRFAEKKGPTFTVRAFARAHREFPEARLRMLGDGPLLDESRALARELGVAHAVEFLGSRPHDEVPGVLRAARAFVQHSLVAASGDSEGTPVAVLEAGASGLPVISTRHAGIPDVVADGTTGLLVEERDVEGMAANMLAVLRDPELAGRMGRAARARINEHFSMDRSIERLWGVIERAIADHRAVGAARSRSA